MTKLIGVGVGVGVGVEVGAPATGVGVGVKVGAPGIGVEVGAFGLTQPAPSASTMQIVGGGQFEAL